MDKVKLGIVGLGTIADHHLRALSTLKGIAIEAAAESNPRRRDTMARKWNIRKCFEHDDEMYKNTALDGVFICIPNHLHYEATNRALEHDVHVFCEKPFGMSSNRAYELGRMARQKRRIITVGYNRRAAENYRKAAHIVRSGRLGKITHVNGVFVLIGPYAGYQPKSSWSFDERGGGVLFDIGSHLIDTVTYIMSQRIAEVASMSINVLDIDVPDNIAGSFRMENGTLGTFDVGWQAARDYASANPSIRLYGTGGLMSVARDDLEESHASSGPLDEVVFLLKRANQTLWNAARRYRQRVDPTYVLEDLAFVDSIRGMTQPLVQLDEAIHVLEVLEAVKKSMEKREWCEVEHHPRVFANSGMGLA